MKTMTCKQLGGACDVQFRADTFEEIAEQSKRHGMEMAEKSDQDHLRAMEAMKEKMKNPAAMQTWMDQKKAEFNSLSSK